MNKRIEHECLGRYVPRQVGKWERICKRKVTNLARSEIGTLFKASFQQLVMTSKCIGSSVWDQVSTPNLTSSYREGG